MPVFTHLQGRQGSLLSPICIGIHLCCCLLVLLRDFPVPVWLPEDNYTEIFSALPVLVAFRYCVLVTLPSFVWGYFSRENLWTLLFSTSANLLSCPNSLFSISFIGKALHGSYVEVWQHLVCFCVPGQPPHASLSWELQGLSFFWTLTVSLSPREKRNTQSKAGRVIWSSVLGAVAVQVASKFKIEGKLLSWKRSSNLLLHLTLL